MRRCLGMSQDGFTAIPFGIFLSVFPSFKTCWNVVVQGHLTEWHDHFLPAIPTKTKLHKLIFYTPEVKKNMYGTSDPTAIKETKTQKTKYVKQKNV